MKWKIKRFWQSNLVLFLGLALLIFLVLNWFKLNSSKLRIDEEINRLAVESQQLEKEYERLTKMKELYQTNFFAEQESRLNLGYAKPGEEMVIIENLPKPSPEEKNFKPSKVNNLKRWFDYFFAPSGSSK